MMIQMKRCISKWEPSGQGEGSIIEQDGNEGEEEKEDGTTLVFEFCSFANRSKVASVILDRASRTMADEDNASWEYTMQSNNTPGSKQSVVDFYKSVQKYKEPWR
jgi:hypothetical protein